MNIDAVEVFATKYAIERTLVFELAPKPVGYDVSKGVKGNVIVCPEALEIPVIDKNQIQVLPIFTYLLISIDVDAKPVKTGVNELFQAPKADTVGLGYVP